VNPYRTGRLILLILVPFISLKGTAQEPEDAFKNDLIAACQVNDIPQVKSLIEEHRLWVKSVVDQLISEYVAEKLSGLESTAVQYREAAILIAETFQTTYGEKSLIIKTGYLEGWSNEDLEKKVIADSLVELALPIRNKETEHEQAIKYYNKALSLYSQLGDQHGEAIIYGALGFIQYYRSAVWYQEDAKLMKEYNQKALRIRVAIDDLELVARSLNDLGIFYHVFENDFTQAIQFYERSKKIREKIGDYQRLGSTLIYLTTCYESNGQYVKALDTYQKTFEVNALVGNKSRMAEAMINSAALLRSTGRYNESLQNLDIALQISKELNDQIGVSNTLIELGNTYSDMGNPEKSIELYSEAAEIMRYEEDLQGQAAIYNNIGTVLQEIGRFEKAAEYYRRSLEICEDAGDKKGFGTALGNLGNTFYDLGDFVRAEQNQYRALNISRELEIYDNEIHNLINLSNAQNALGKLDSAQFHCSLALEKATELNSPQLIWISTLNLGDNYERRGDYQKAIEHYELALRIVEDIRLSLSGEEFRTGYMSRERFAFEGMVHLLGSLHQQDPKKGYDEIAFLYAERSKSRAFLDMLSDSIQPATLQEVQNSLTDNQTTLLEYFLGDSSSCLWVISEKEHKMLVLPGRNDIKDYIETIRFSLIQPDESNLSFLSEAARKLYEQLINPAVPFLYTGNKLVIIPDGELFYLPFELLLSSEPEKGKSSGPASLPYLLRKYPITYGHSATIFMNIPSGMAAHKNRQPRLLAFGDPYFSTEYKRLAYSADEVQMIASYFDHSSADVFLQQKASEERVKTTNLDQYQYIHFATHGNIDEVNPDLSSLVLAQDTNRNEDGMLQAWEIMDLSMKADLVVLSACQTGLGKMIRGEGIVGLTRALIYSGASSVLVSLWSVADHSTSMFMTEFYKNLIISEMGKSIALQKTKLYMMSNVQLAHPFYWAPFILFGNK